MKTFRKQDIVIISDKEMINPGSQSRAFGLYYAGADGAKTNLAMPIWHWGVFYERIIRSILSGAWKSESETADDLQALNYWWGMSAGAIDLIYSDKIPSGTLQLMHLAQGLCLRQQHSFLSPGLSMTRTRSCGARKACVRWRRRM